MNRRELLAGLASAALSTAAAEPAGPLFENEMIFPLDAKHNHASCIVELPNADLLTCWYRGSGERTADDVAIMGARKRKGSKQLRQ